MNFDKQVMPLAHAPTNIISLMVCDMSVAPEELDVCRKNGYNKNRRACRRYATISIGTQRLLFGTITNHSHQQYIS